MPLTHGRATLEITKPAGSFAIFCSRLRNSERVGSGRWTRHALNVYEINPLTDVANQVMNFTVFGSTAHKVNH
jgi:hypothetical protein